MSMFPYNQDNALTGPARVLWAPITEPVPADLSDIIALVNTGGAYAPQGGWQDFGLAAGAPSYSRGIETEGLEYEQPSGALFEQVTAVNRSVTANVGEITPEAVQILENAPSIEDIAAAPNQSAQKKVPYGSFTESELYRIAIIAMRPKAAAKVTEPDGTERGALVANVIYRCGLSADEASIEIAKGEPVAIEIGFTAFPEPGQPSGEEYGTHLFEVAGTISAT